MLVELLSKRPPFWAAFALAVVLVLATLLLRHWLGVAFGDRPLLILFVFPIIISAHFGGLWPGILATFLAAGIIDYYLIPPVRSFVISSTHDLIQLLMLIVSGALVSVLNEALSRSRRRAESSQQLQAATLASLGEAVVTTDRAGHITYLNSQAERLTGWPKSEAVGLTLGEVVVLVDEDDRKPLVNVIQAALGSQDSGQLPSVALLQKREGGEITISINSAPILDDRGATKGMVLALSDITDRKLAEEQLSISKERFRIIAEYTYDWEAWHDQNGKVAWINPAVERITGYGVNECLAMEDYPCRLADNSHRQVIEAILEEAQAGRVGNDVQFRILHKDGTHR